MEEFLGRKEFGLPLPTLQCYVTELLVGVFSCFSQNISYFLRSPCSASLLGEISFETPRAPLLTNWLLLMLLGRIFPGPHGKSWQNTLSYGNTSLHTEFSLLSLFMSFPPVLERDPPRPSPSLTSLLCAADPITSTGIAPHHRWAFLWSLSPTDFFAWLDCCPNFPSFFRK